MVSVPKLPPARVLLLLTVAVLAASGLLSRGSLPAAAGGGCPLSRGASGTFEDQMAVPILIPDNDPGGMTSCIAIGDSRTINDLDVTVNIQHDWIGDLAVTITHEDTGTTVVLIDQPGVPASGSLGCDGNNIAARLNDGAASAVEDVCAPTTPTISGTFRPNEMLSAFNGESMAGVWRIRVRDRIVEGQGFLNSWSLIAGLAGAPPGDVNCSGATNSIDAAFVLQYGAALIASLACPATADVNGDGRIDALDAALILQFIAGLLPGL